MSKWNVTHTVANGTTVTVVTAAGVGESNGFLVFINENDTLVASFPVGRVVSVIKVKKDKPAKAPELTEVSRKHPVYAYGKGDLRDALVKAVNLRLLEGLDNTNYLRDIIRDLQVGK